MNRLILILLLVACAPLTEDEQFARDYNENDRKAQYARWEQWCLDSGGIVYYADPLKPCMSRRNCIPHRWDWRYDNETERPSLGNSVLCLSRDQLDEVLRNF
jgi:hypothetical protein